MPNFKMLSVLIPLSVAIGIAAISFSSIFVRWSEAPVSVIAMYRLWLANVLLLPWLAGNWREISRLTGKQWLLLLATGGALGLHFLLWMASLRFTSVSSSTSLLTLEPIFVMLAGIWWFRQKPQRSELVGMGIAVIGAMLIGWHDFSFTLRSLQGDLLSLLGAAAVAVHMLIGKQLRETMSAYVYSFFSFFLAACLLAVYNLFRSIPLGGYGLKEWGVFMLLAAVPTLFGHYLFNWLLKYLRAASVSMTVLGEPAGSTLLALILLNEPVTYKQLLAMMILLFGVWIFLRKKEYSRRKTHKLNGSLDQA
ncbi:DMT family transporter [Ferviditalea candida]|uniref:DMT family transporter n=1 Tax=Ferviditalea candida TaxID=3108399 RepID=A0ABU5ZN28_9BACL|nr:DMT family transporter [Paenibacillaceae bacterium T2]